MKLESIKQYINGYLAYKKLDHTPIIIGGCERSGTSLLQSIISSHPQIHSIEEETWAFCYGPATGFSGNKPIRLKRLIKALGTKQIPESCNRWCEKSPANIFYFNEIIKYFSNNVKLIHIIRDGRDVISSIHPDNPSKPWVSSDRWIQAAQAGYQYRNQALVLTIKYEDLINEYDKTIRLICGHIGIPLVSEILNWHKHTKIKSNKNLIGNTVNKISSKSINKHQAVDFQFKEVVDKFMQDEKASQLLKDYGYLQSNV